MIMADWVMPSFDDDEEAIAAEAPTEQPASKWVMPEFEDDPEPKKAVEMPGMLQGLSQQAAQGLLMDWADEAAGLTGVQPTETFRAQEKMFREENPFASTAAQIVGGVAPMAFPATRRMALNRNLGRLPAFAGTARNIGLPAMVGATYGAISGAGQAESFDDIIDKTWKGALTGAIATPTIQAAGKLIGGAGRSAVEAVKGLAGSKSPGPGGVDLLAKAMKEEGLDPNVIRQQVEERTRATGKPVMWMDMVDPNKYPKTYDLMSKGLLEGTSTGPKMKVIERGEGTGARLISDIESRINKAGTRAYTDLMAAKPIRSEQWKAGFDALKGRNVGTPEVKEILDRPFAQKVIGDAIELAKNRGDTNAKAMFANFVSNDPTTGKFVWAKEPTLELIQTIKNLGYTPALKAVYGGADVGADTATILQQQRELMNAVKQAVPEYGNVLKNYADSMSLENARELGANLQSALTKGSKTAGGKMKGVGSKEIIEEYQSMSLPERKHFLQGLAWDMIQNVERKGGSEGASQALSVVGDPTKAVNAKVKQLKEIFGDSKRVKSFLDRLDAERTIEKTTKEFSKRKGATFENVAGKSARDLVRIGGASLLGRLASALPGIGSQVGSFVAGQSPRLMQPVGEIAAQMADETAPLLGRLQSQYGREMGQLTTSDVFNPYLTATVGSAVADNFKAGGLAKNNQRKGALAQCGCSHTKR